MTGTTAHLAFQTEIEFELPKGYLDQTGTLHRTGTMRLATAADEILPLRDPRVQQNEGYLAVIVLARVITRLGSLPEVHTGTIEGLYASDLAYLERLYQTFNASEDTLRPQLASEKLSNFGDNSLRRVNARGEA
jgi:hypothetical protein